MTTLERLRQHQAVVAATVFLLMGLACWLLLRMANPSRSMSSLATPPASRLDDRLSEADRALQAFFAAEAPVVQGGPSLVQTDFFRPAAPPAPPKPPPPKPAPEKAVAVTYRGLVDLGDGRRVAYLLIDGKVLTKVAGDAVAGPWMVRSFDRDALVLGNGAENGDEVRVPFNRNGTVRYPVAEAPPP